MTDQVGLWRDEQHRYTAAYPGEEPQTYSISITDALKSLDKPAIPIWKARLTAEAAVKNVTRLAEMVTEGGTEATVEYLMKIADHKRDAKAATGTDVHSLIEGYYLAARTPPLLVAPEVQPYWDAFLRFDDEFRPDVIAVEYLVCSPTYGYAGTGDLVALMWCSADAKLCRFRLDAKTMGVYPAGHMKAGRLKGPYVETALQLAAAEYAEFCGRPGDPKKYSVPRADHCGVLALAEDGRYQVVPYSVDKSTFVAFRAALAARRWLTGEAKTVIGQPLTPRAIVDNVA